MDTKIENSDFPPLFIAADKASVRSQRIYMWCVALDLTLVASAGLAGAIALENERGKFILAVITGILMALGLFLTFLIKQRQFERAWFDGRAVAESVKTSSWRFMMGSEPYIASLNEAKATALFVKLLTTVVQEKLFTTHLITIAQGNDFEITPKMKQIRALSVAEKKAVYLKERLNDQKLWYTKKAGENVKKSNLWFYAILGAQGLGTFSTYLIVNYPAFPILLPSVFAAIAAAFVAWLQLKRHQELIGSYGMAAKELNYIIAKMEEVTDQDKLSVFVADAENAISREHTMWIARRDQA